MAKEANSSTDARERARQIAAKQSKTKAKSNRLWIQLTILAVVLVIVGIVATVVINNKNNEVADAGPVPSSANEYGGITATKDGIEKDTSATPSRDINSQFSATASVSASDGASAQPLPLGIENAEEAKSNGQPVHVVLFQDYNCPHCAAFEATNGDTIKNLVDQGKITLEVRNLTFLDREYAGEYSARSANAAYSVANQVSTDDFLDWQKEIFTHQGEILSNDQIIEIAKKHGADITEDMKNNTWRSLVNVVTPESSLNGVSGTPTLYADGQAYDLSTGDLGTFLNGIIDAKANK